jgi:hypothetical protein
MGWKHTELDDETWGKGRQERVSKNRGAAIVVTMMTTMTTNILMKQATIAVMKNSQQL